MSSNPGWVELGVRGTSVYIKLDHKIQTHFIIYQARGYLTVWIAMSHPMKVKHIHRYNIPLPLNLHVFSEQMLQ